MEPEELIDFYPPLVSNREWIALRNAEPDHVWVHIPLKFDSFEEGEYHFLECVRWMALNCRHPVYDSTFWDFYFYSPQDALLFKLWLQI